MNTTKANIYKEQNAKDMAFGSHSKYELQPSQGFVI